jgi:hypothetical protein
VNTVLNVVKKSGPQNLDGKPLDIRKNPHAIDVGLRANMQHSYWYIM